MGLLLRMQHQSSFPRGLWKRSAPQLSKLLATPEAIEEWSLTTLEAKLIQTHRHREDPAELAADVEP